VADYPSSYRGHPLLPVLVEIPNTWDDTRCLAGKVGEYAVVARRKGDEWWIGAMAGREPRELDVSIEFLGAGEFRARVYSDDLKSKFGLTDRQLQVHADDPLRVTLAPAGGALVRLSPMGGKPEEPKR
jgi:alpha-glucosidase